MFKSKISLFVGLLLLLVMSPLSAKADEPLGKGTVWTAAQKGDLASLKLLLRRNPKLVDARRVMDKGTADEVDWTPLTIAASAGKIEAVKYLLSQGATVDLQRSNGHTALYDVIFWGKKPSNVTIARLLIAKGANVNQRTSTGFIPLNYANDAAMVKLLLDKGSKINGHANVRALTPLQAFARYQLPEMSKSKAGFSEALSVMKVMISRGANLKYKDKSGKKAADYAEKIADPVKRQQAVKLLSRQ